MRTNRTYVVLALLLGLGLAAALIGTKASAQTTSPADALIAQVAQTTNSLTSFSADFDEIDSYTGKYKDLKQSGTVLLAKPALLSISVRRYRRVDSSSPWGPSGNDTLSVSDGSSYWYAFVHPHSTQVKQSKVNAKVLSSALRSIPTLQNLLSPNPSSALPDQDGPATIVGPAEWEGASYTVVTYAAATNGDQDLSASAYIGQDDIIHRLIYSGDAGSGPVTKEWQLHNIKTNPALTASDFAYSPPADAVPYDSSVSGPLLAAGTAAPDFTASDINGNPVKLSDFRGKTVVLDFWATWCWPCNQSLPHTEQVAESFSGKNIVILAVAIRDSKAGFISWIHRHHYPAITFAVDTQPEGKDVASILYNVSVTPTAYVINGEGQIVQSIVGYTGPTDQLASAITAASQTDISDAVTK